MACTLSCNIKESENSSWSCLLIFLRMVDWRKPKTGKYWPVKAHGPVTNCNQHPRTRSGFPTRCMPSTSDRTLGGCCRWREWEMATEAKQQKVCPATRVFTATATIRLLKELGKHAQAPRQTIIETSRTAERCSQWFWIRSKDPNWAPQWAPQCWAYLSGGCLIKGRNPQRDTQDTSLILLVVTNTFWWLAIYHQTTMRKAFKHTRDIHHLVLK